MFGYGGFGGCGCGRHVGRGGYGGCGYGAPAVRGYGGNGFALIVVLFILLIIIGAAFCN